MDIFEKLKKLSAERETAESLHRRALSNIS